MPYLDALSADDMEPIRKWRNAGLQHTLRTPYLLTAEQQMEWYKNEICNRESHTRYWAIRIDMEVKGYEAQPPTIPVLLGYGGIERIEWENSRGEISLLIRPDQQRQGHGSWAAGEFLRRAFEYLNLNSVYGECYTCSPAIPFWEKMVDGWNGTKTVHPDAKYHDGLYYPSMFFTFERDAWRGI